MSGTGSDVMEEGGGGLAATGWRTEEAGVSRLVERAFSRPRSMNGEMEGGGTKGEQCFGLGRACLKFGESYKLFPHLKFRTYCGLGVGQPCQVSQMWAG